MSRLWGAGVLALIAGMAAAEPVKVTIRPVPEFTEGSFQWEAFPFALDSGVISMDVQTSGGTIPGDWSVPLEPGIWLVTGFGEMAVLFGEVKVSAAGEVFEIKPEEPIPPPPFRCPDVAEGCVFRDPATLIEFRLPQGWAADQPYHADLGDGTLAPEVSTVFFEEMAAEGGEAWFLNPVDWIVEEAGPCRETALGNLCAYGEASPAAEAAFDVLAPSLRAITAEEAAAP